MTAPDLRPSVPPETASRHFDPVLRPDLAALYATRAARLRRLAPGHELSAYLSLVADITDGQAACLRDGGRVDPDPQAMATDGDWPQMLDHLIAHLDRDAPGQVAELLAELRAMPDTARRQAALALVQGRFDAVAPGIAPFVWAALSVAVAQAARLAPLPAPATREPTACPVCGTAPVASLIHTGQRQGLRYLHCALCECEWHMVRAKCSDCGDNARLDYLSFDTPEAAIRAESCGACGGYLKTVSHESDPEVEVVADDLASLVLDDAASAEGYGRSGFNPFALPAG
ncbi:formate dehydrogenase accessory protein FdhE [Paracoccus sp. DMF-8]|uniref:formate dehydrogenase accessory protein FdhE n=1 Tax=Paracoccus sp. DMF-8 TaxID=3019445 RepID=UPI0023E888A5|nr:formate dehydrogenase accessory protein FdhE [Paracoccus sp. DMF-8]MDF3606474.1 formate dehydrogenase accessory protein FdhE [Paracoccus sp. DMF-8]